MRTLLALLLLAGRVHGQDVLAPILVTAPSSTPAVVFGQENKATLASTSSAHTVSFTVTNADLLIVCVTATWAAPSSVTYNGDAVTLQVSRENSGYGSFIYTRANPDVGTANVVVNWAGSTDATVTVLGYKKTHNTTPVSGADFAEGTSTSPAVTITSATGSVVIDCLGWYSWIATASATGGQTEQSNLTVGDIGGAVSTKAGAASVNMAWTISTSREWAHTAISVNPE